MIGTTIADLVTRAYCVDPHELFPNIPPEEALQEMLDTEIPTTTHGALFFLRAACPLFGKHSDAFHTVLQKGLKKSRRKNC